MKGEANGLLRGEQVREPEFALDANQFLLGFDSLEPAGVREDGEPLVDVMWEDGHAIRKVPSATPAFTIRSTADKKAAPVIVTLARADHIQELHLAHRESGSYFTPKIHPDYTSEPVTLVMLMEQIATTLRSKMFANIGKRATLQLPSGELPGREGVISLDELLALGTISETTYQIMLKAQDRIIRVNSGNSSAAKENCVADINTQLAADPVNPLSLKLIRKDEGGVVVPHVFAMPQPTSQMMVELGREGKGSIFIHTVAPGRRMPRHPIKRLYQEDTGAVNVSALHNAAWRWSTMAHVEMPPDEPPYLQRTIELLTRPGFMARFVELTVAPEAKELKSIQTGALQRTAEKAKQEAIEVAAFRANRDVEAIKSIEVEMWRIIYNDVKREVFPFTEGLPLQAFLTRYHREKILNSPEHLTALGLAEAALEKARHSAEERLAAVIGELQDRANEPALLAALDAWTTSPASDRDRAHDGKGYNAGLLHFFEYRGAKTKYGRFELIDEEPTVDGFIEFTNRLVAALDRRLTPGPGEQVAVFEDDEGNSRVYILLPGEKGEFIVAFQYADEATPKLCAMFNKVTQQGFEKMVKSVLEGNDRGQIKRLEGGIRLVYQTT